jgi:thioredoxin 2
MLRRIRLQSNVEMILFVGAACAPCRVMRPRVEAAARKLGVLLEVIDASAKPGMAARHGVQSVPTLLVRMGQRVIAQTSKIRSTQRLEEWITAMIGDAAEPPPSV